MIIDFTLTTSTYLKHNEVITLPDTVELHFNRTVFSAGELILTVVKGETMGKQYKVPKEGTVDITEFFGEAGEVSASLSLAVRGEVARVWQIEPFCAREIPNGIEVLPEVEHLKEEVATLKRAIVELNTIINEQEI